MDFVYPWINTGPAAEKELAYSVRSVEEMYCGSFRIIIVGDCPPRMGGIIHLPHKRLPDPDRPKALDAVRKMERILACPHIQEDFCYMYDDVVLLQPTTDEHLRHLHAVRELHGEAFTSKHGRMLTATYQAMKAAGHGRVWNYETHTPRVFNKQRMRQVLERYRPAQGRLLLPTLYFNHHWPKATPELLSALNPIKAGFYGNPADPYSLPTAPTDDEVFAAAHYATQCRGRRYLNWDDRGLHPGLIRFLRNTYPNPSTCERDGRAWVHPEP